MTPVSPTQTIDAARRALATRFIAASLDSPELDARLLVGAAVNLDLTGLITQGTRNIVPDEAARLDTMAQRRLAGEPIARILGLKEFWGLSLRLSSDTLVPRPDTETIVELALASIDTSAAALRIADLGTGSGAILLALLSELSAAFGVGTDLSLGALHIARDNARALNFADRASFVACSYASALSGPFDLIASNPPYIRSCDVDGLDLEVRAHDPRRALDGGTDGLDAYRALIPESVRLLRPGGVLVLEIGQGQGRDVELMMTAAGLLQDLPPKTDLAGVTRALMGRKKPR